MPRARSRKARRHGKNITASRYLQLTVNSLHDRNSRLHTCTHTHTRETARSGQRAGGGAHTHSAERHESAQPQALGHAARTRRRTVYTSGYVISNNLLTFYFIPINIIDILNWHVEVIKPYSRTLPYYRFLNQNCGWLFRPHGLPRRRCLGEFSWNQQQRYSGYP